MYTVSLRRRRARGPRARQDLPRTGRPVPRGDPVVGRRGSRCPARTAVRRDRSDFQMPGMDGISFLRAVRSEFGDIPFLLSTGRGREEVAIAALNSGADRYLQRGGDPVAQDAEPPRIRQAVLRREAEQVPAARRGAVPAPHGQREGRGLPDDPARWGVLLRQPGRARDHGVCSRGALRGTGPPATLRPPRLAGLPSGDVERTWSAGSCPYEFRLSTGRGAPGGTLTSGTCS